VLVGRVFNLEDIIKI